MPRHDGGEGCQAMGLNHVVWHQLLSSPQNLLPDWHHHHQHHHQDDNLLVGITQLIRQLFS
jgi:hypothetical protein